MNRWSTRSQGMLDTCDDRLIALFDRVLFVQDCTILCGFRGQNEQEEAFRTGHSKVNWPDSKHNHMVPSMAQGGDDICRSLAVDVAPYPIDWTNRYRFAWFAGIVFGIASEMDEVDRQMIWGGNWDGGDLEPQRFDDLVHFELG